MYKVKIQILLKDDVLDPQGKTVQRALEHLEYKDISNVRIGKYIEFVSGEQDEKVLKQSVDEMCKKILTNTVIEKFSFTLEKI
ncbi:MAG: phosphoribosylformylglycinamidine synthase subunit PurS [Candidatus Margulisbacteria bacterium]|nr:phosphoribosylformylglycinamidine synthase subunit PurS [Candidatus Margulisiibacteriota bacterium]